MAKILQTGTFHYKILFPATVAKLGSDSGAWFGRTNFSAPPRKHMSETSKDNLVTLAPVLWKQKELTYNLVFLHSSVRRCEQRDHAKSEEYTGYQFTL